MTPGDPVRIGLAGYGRGGRFFHAPLIGLAPECTLAAVRGEGPLPVDPRDAVAALEVLDTARVSAARGEVVRLS